MEKKSQGLLIKSLNDALNLNNFIKIFCVLFFPTKRKHLEP